MFVTFRSVACGAAFAAALGCALPARAQTADPVIGLLLAAGDVARCTGRGGQQQETGALIAREIRNAPPGVPVRVLALGDLAYQNGEPGEFANCFDPAWGSFKQLMLPVPGNHEYHRKLPNGVFDKRNGSKHAAPYFNYFRDNAAVRQNGAQAGYYAVNFPDAANGPWQLIGLNPYVGIDATSRQLSFVRNVLEQGRGMPCVIAFAHYSRFSSGHHGHSKKKDAAAPLRADASMLPVFEALYGARASLFLAGHDHHFEQLGRADPQGRPQPDGLRSFILGTGGASLYKVDYENKWPFTEATSIKDHGVLKIALRARSYSWRFIPVGGAVRGMKVMKDVSSDTCNR